MNKQELWQFIIGTIVVGILMFATLWYLTGREAWYAGNPNYEETLNDSTNP